MKRLALLLICCLCFACLNFSALGKEQASRAPSNISKPQTSLIDKKLEQAKEQQKAPKSTVIEKKSILHKILMYIPNRFVDLSDIITMELGFGPEVSCELTLTKYCQFGVRYGDRYFIEKGYNRQYGGGYYSGYNASFVCLNDEMGYTDYTFGTVKPYFLLRSESDIPSLRAKPYSNGLRDFWKIGLHVGWMVDLGIAIHPVAIANFFTGFVFVRLTDTKEL